MTTTKTTKSSKFWDWFFSDSIMREWRDAWRILHGQITCAYCREILDTAGDTCAGDDAGINEHQPHRLTRKG